MGRSSSVADRATDGLLGIFILATVASALIGVTLGALANLSASGIALAVLFTTVVGILIAVGLFNAFKKAVKF